MVITLKLLLVTFLDEFSLKFAASEQVPVYISEITPKNLRGGFATVNQVCIILNQGSVITDLFRALY